MMRIGIIGPESTGKTTLAKELAQEFNGICVPEYAREYVEKRGTTEITYEELEEIARYQIDELAKQGDGLYFFDTELIVTKVWFDYAFGRVPEWLNEAIKRFPMDAYLLTKPDIPWISDPARSNGSDAIRQELFDRYEADIQALDIPYYIIEHI